MFMLTGGKQRLNTKSPTLTSKGFTQSAKQIPFLHKFYIRPPGEGIRMVDPLTSLDELVWKQFEKVTNYAHKNYGWDKYDLAKTSHFIGSAAMTGVCTYTSIDEILQQSYGGFVLTSLMIVPIVFHHKSQCSFYEKLEEIERKIALAAGAVIKYSSDSLRFALTATSLGLTAFGVNSFAQEGDNKQALAGLALTLFGIGLAGSQAAHYFMTQLPSPPSTKKPFWKTIYQRISSKLKLKPRLEPATEPVVIAKYKSIEKLVG